MCDLQLADRITEEEWLSDKAMRPTAGEGNLSHHIQDIGRLHAFTAQERQKEL